MSRSVEYLNLSDIGTVFDKFKIDNFKALGQNVSLKYLDLTNCSIERFETDIKRLAHAVAINSQNPRGQLQELILDNFFSNYHHLDKFLERMWVTEQLKERWFGDEEVAEAMPNEDKTRHFVCDLKTLVIDGCNLSVDSPTGFWTKKQVEDYENGIVQPMGRFPSLFSTMSKLEKLSMKNCCISELQISQLKAAIKGNVQKEEKRDITNPKISNALKYWNLSGCAITPRCKQYITDIVIHFENLETFLLENCSLKPGHVSSLGKWLSKASKLKHFDISRNKIYCDGVKTLLKSINAENSQLEYLDISFCQLRDSGLKVLGEELATGKFNIKGVSAKRN